MMYAVIIRLARFLARILYRHHVYGIENWRAGPAIIAPNHVSFLDPPLTAISAPEHVYFLARKTLFKGVFGRLIYALNARPVSADAVNTQVFREIESILKEGKKVIIFPEGTRGTTGEMGEVKSGVFLLFQRTHCFVQPTYLIGTKEAWGKGVKRPQLFAKTGCVFGAPIEWKYYAHLEKKDAARCFAADLRQKIIDLKRWYEEGACGTPP